jgi:hypothetical protein
VRERLQSIAREHPRVIIWGVGTLTLHLIATGGFDAIEVVALVDSNARYQGKAVNGTPIVSPAELPALGSPVVFSSWGFRTEMADQLQNSHSHKVTTLAVFDDALSRNLSTN